MNDSSPEHPEAGQPSAGGAGTADYGEEPDPALPSIEDYIARHPLAALMGALVAEYGPSLFREAKASLKNRRRRSDTVIDV